MTGDNRGLYGQTESDAGATNAAAQTLLNPELEGERRYEGTPTEALYRRMMGAAAVEDIQAERAEGKISDRDAGAKLERIVQRMTQRGALTVQADLYAEMIAAGFSQEVAERTLASARAVGYGMLSEGRGAGAPKKAPALMKIKSRRPPTMYNPERHGLLNADGSSRVNSAGAPLVPECAKA